jgi:dihydroneopterin aldolase
LIERGLSKLEQDPKTYSAFASGEDDIKKRFNISLADYVHRSLYNMTVTGPNTVTYENKAGEIYEITFSAYNKATKVKVEERKPELVNQHFYPMN